MYRHWHRFIFGLPPFHFWFRGPGCLPCRAEYIRMLEDYQSELKPELEEVNKDLGELKKTG